MAKNRDLRVSKSNRENRPIVAQRTAGRFRLLSRYRQSMRGLRKTLRVDRELRQMWIDNLAACAWNSLVNYDLPHDARFALNEAGENFLDILLTG
jgi:hypothetical protein